MLFRLTARILAQVYSATSVTGPSRPLRKTDALLYSTWSAPWRSSVLCIRTRTEAPSETSVRTNVASPLAVDPRDLVVAIDHRGNRDHVQPQVLGQVVGVARAGQDGPHDSRVYPHLGDRNAVRPAVPQRREDALARGHRTARPARSAST
jgi:hypothetical protein